MLDVNVIRADPDKIREMLRNRNKDEAILDRFLEADGEWRSLTDENNRLRQTRNEVSLQISKMPKGSEKDAKIAEMREVSDKIKANDDRMAQLEEIRTDCVLNIPNIPAADVPLGKDEHDNVVVYEAGRRREFDFTPKQHFEIAEDLGIIDFDRAVKVAGSTASRETVRGSRGHSSTSSWTRTRTRGTPSCSRQWSSTRPRSSGRASTRT